MAGIPVTIIISTLIEESGLSEQLNVSDVIKYKKMMGFKSVAEVGTPPIDIVVDIAKKYRGKKPMAVASSGFRDHVVHSLKMNGIYEYFDAIVTAEDIKNSKPAPDIFLLAAERIGCNPIKCRGYEDADAGMQSLRAAGLEAIDVRLMDGYPKVIPSSESVLAMQAHDSDGSALFSVGAGSMSMVVLPIAILAIWYSCRGRGLFKFWMKEK